MNYINAYATFVDKNTVQYVDKKKETKKITAKYFVVATGGRPTYPTIPGAELGEWGVWRKGRKEKSVLMMEGAAISSDDIFRMKKAPGKTLVIGAGYVALECAGFLRELGECGRFLGQKKKNYIPNSQASKLGYSVKVMVRSKVLRTSDSQCAEIVKSNMERLGIDFVENAVPTKFEKTV